MRREHSRKKEPTDGRERIDLARIQAPHPPSCFLSLDVVKQRPVRTENLEQQCLWSLRKEGSFP